jgi:hypothetical protein
MASQRVLLLAIGGVLAESIWKDILRWNDARTSAANDEWSSDDWPAAIRDEIDAFVTKITCSAFTPPILYRSEHVDCWSMGDVFHTAMVKAHPETRQLYTTKHGVIATRGHFKAQIVLEESTHDETIWIYNRLNEAIAASGYFADDRLIILVRSVLGALWDQYRTSE